MIIFRTSPDVEVIPVSGTSYSLTEVDSGKVLGFTSGSPVTVTAPNSVPVGFNVVLVQDGAGQVTVVAASGASIKTEDSNTKTKLAGQNASASLLCLTNAGGASAAYNLGGSTTA
jgi:hypothetical protein